MDKPRYIEFKKEIGRNMCDEVIYETVYVPNFINCNKCKKETIGGICIDWVKEGVHKGCGIFCAHCHEFNFSK